MESNGQEERKEKADKTKQNLFSRIRKNPRAMAGMLILAVLILVGGVAYWQTEQTKIYVEKAEISAPVISLGPQHSGILEQINVDEGEHVLSGKIVARLQDGSVVRAETSGIVVSVKNVPGQMVSTSDALVKMIEPRELRVIGRVDENKGLSEIHVGQRVIFNVDAFGAKEYVGVVDGIGSTSRQSDIVFSISDKREQRQFEVKVKYDVSAYPELKNGMSARLWVYKQ
jgi:multidrug resistance efflux pump